MKKIQIVIDTNIFISALKNDTGASFYLLSLIGTGSVEVKKTRICRLYLLKQLVVPVMPACHKALQPIDIIESPIQLNQCQPYNCSEKIEKRYCQIDQEL
jgi:hypothetical protein